MPSPHVSPQSRLLRVVAPILALALLLPILLPRSAAAERPTTPLLLPHDTVAYVSAPNVPELVEDFQKTAIGQMLKQKQMKSLLDQLYAEAKKAAKPLEERLGLSLEELAAIPQGEITFAVVAQEDKFPAFVGFIDVNEQIVAADRLLEAAVEARRTKRKIGDVEVTVVSTGGDAVGEVIYFERDGTICFCTDADVLQRILNRWNGERTKTFEGNKKFNTIRTKCKGAEGEAAHFFFYADPLAIVNAFTREQEAVQLVLTLLEPLGINGFQALGGSVALSTEHFDQVTRLHVMLENPREGLIQMIALRSGDVTPEEFVPANVVGYTTFHWDLKRTYQAIVELIENFQGKGFVEDQIKSGLARAELDIDVEKDIFGALADRYTIFSWIQQPVMIDSQHTLFAIHLKDGGAFEETYKKLVSRFENNLEKQTYAGKDYYRVQTGSGPPARPAPETPDAPGGVQVRLQARPNPCFGLVGDYLFISTQPGVLEEAIKTMRAPSSSLANSEDFKTIMDEITEIAGENEPSLVQFSRPEEGLKYFYDLAVSKDTRRGLEQLGENNEFLGVVNQALKDNPLPPFEELARFVAPAGAVLIDDETGIHYVSFGLKRSADAGKEKREK